MSSIQSLESRREGILSEMRSMRSMRRGSVHEQYFSVQPKGKREPVRRGPYYVWTYSEGGKTVSRRLSPGPELDRAREDVARHKRFVALCEEFERLTEQLGQLEWDAEGATPEKKRRRSPSKRTGR